MKKIRYMSRLTDEVFDSEEEIIEHLKKEDVEGDYDLYYDLIEVEEDNIDDTPEDSENLDEIDSMSEEELKDLARAKLGVDAYMNAELDPTQEKMLISRLLGKTGDKSVNKKIHDKVFPEKANTSNAFEKQYQHIIERLQDPQSTICNLCNKEWSRIAEEETTILSSEKSKVGIPLIRIIHIKTKHIPVWNLIADLFGMPAEKIPDERVSTTPNPENVSATELSKEELAEAICESPEARRAFFKEWLRRLNRKE